MPGYDAPLSVQNGTHQSSNRAQFPQPNRWHEDRKRRDETDKEMSAITTRERLLGPEADRSDFPMLVVDCATPWEEWVSLRTLRDRGVITCMNTRLPNEMRLMSNHGMVVIDDTWGSLCQVSDMYPHLCQRAALPVASGRSWLRMCERVIAIVERNALKYSEVEFAVARWSFPSFFGMHIGFLGKACSTVGRSITHSKARAHGRPSTSPAGGCR